MEQSLLQTGIITLLGLVAFLLRKKDEEQEKSILSLFKKHDEDVLKLQQLELRIAQEHYIKPELDARFERLETAFKEGFTTLGDKFDRLSEILITHIAKEDARNEDRQK